MLTDIPGDWSAADSARLYQIAQWSKGYFSIAEKGNVLVHPSRNPQQAIDLKELVDRLGRQGVDLPVLLRFNGILEDRLEAMNGAFQTAIDEYGYCGDYCHVFPIKVNQDRHVVNQMLEAGARFGFGLEAGSKPELLAIVAMANNSTPITCNGFKDAEYIRMALLAQKMGRSVETIRYTLKQFDQANPDLAVFPDNQVSKYHRAGLPVLLCLGDTGIRRYRRYRHVGNTMEPTGTAAIPMIKLR